MHTIRTYHLHSTVIPPRAMRKRLYRLLLSAIVLLACTTCTENPFENNDAPVSSTRSVRGQVQLSDRGLSGGAYVWMEGFNYGTYSNDDGDFSIQLPPPAAQGVPGGVSGAYRTYAYLGNYRSDHAMLGVRDGNFLYPTEYVDDDGTFLQPFMLQELYSITTTLSKTRIEADSPRVLSVTVTLRSSAGGVAVWYPLMVDGIEGPMLIHNLGTGDVRIIRTAVSGIELRDNIVVGFSPYERSMLLSIPKYSLKAGTYEILPYLLTAHTDVPATLFESLGTDVRDLSPEYVRHPFLRSGGILTVVNQ